nr:cytochrome c biogenesis protein CcdA [Cellulosimicrobium arenosum]
MAGAVAAFNPCGFALLPAYLTLLVASPPEGEGSTAAAVRRGALFAAAMTTGFVAVFAVLGLALSTVATGIERWLPVLTIAVGVALVALGAWLLTGHSLGIAALGRYGWAPRRSWWSQVGYGVTFALASLSCTIAPFLAVTGGAMSAGGALAALAVYVVYALGMGAVVGVLALAAATASAGLVGRMRRAAPVVYRLSGVLLVLAGAYVAWYGWYELRVLAGSATGDPVVDAAVRAQSAVVRFVAETGAGAVVVALAVLAVAAVAAGLAVRRRRRAAAGEPDAARG